MSQALKIQSKKKTQTLPTGAGYCEVSLQVPVYNNTVTINARSRKNRVPAVARGKLSVTQVLGPKG